MTTVKAFQINKKKKKKYVENKLSSDVCNGRNGAGWCQGGFLFSIINSYVQYAGNSFFHVYQCLSTEPAVPCCFIKGQRKLDPQMKTVKKVGLPNSL